MPTSKSPKVPATHGGLDRDPYAVLTHRSGATGVALCQPSDHARKKNCTNNPWCLYGLGEKKEGIYKLSIAELGGLGPGNPRTLCMLCHACVL